MIPADKNSSNTILELIHSLRDLEQRAVLEFRPVVEEILFSSNRDAQRIEQTLDGLLDFCGNEAVVLMYRQLCRHYWEIDQPAALYYINAYREQWQSDDQSTCQ